MVSQETVACPSTAVEPVAWPSTSAAANYNYRLPKCVVPRCYNLELWVDLDSCEFKGNLEIDVEIKENTSIITLNSVNLIVDKESVYLSQEEKVIHPIRLDFDDQEELMVLQFSACLPLTRATLNIHCHGVLDEKLSGFYRSPYESGGVKKNMAVTCLEPADARRFFPCWDEPDFKASFKFKVHAPLDRMVLSTMPIVEEVIVGDDKLVEFEKSPLMSTYLVAVVVGEFEYIEALSEDGILVRVYTQIGDLHKSKFGLDTMLKLLPFFSKYFQYPYPLPKLDVVCVPTFKAGALEEFGLIVFRKEAFYVDDTSPSSQKQKVAIDLAHEVAHMWFGDLVTLEWWTHLWLNEGMATWISYMAVDNLFPDWNILINFQKEIIHGLKLDSSKSTHHVEVEAQRAQEVMELFDAITYCKGASMIYMLQHYLGSEILQAGLVRYIQRFAFGNATSDDLWDCLQKASAAPIKDLMHSWTKQKGYPIVKTTCLEDRKIVIEQSQFSTVDDNVRWMIPVLLGSGPSCNMEQTLLFTEQQCTVCLPSWPVKLNFKQTGFYRVQYDPQLLNALKHCVITGSLAATDRHGLVDDMFAFCQAGKEPLSALLSLLNAYTNETDPFVLSKVVDVTLAVSNIVMVAVPSLSPKINDDLLRLLQVPACTLGWEPIEGESLSNSILRKVLLYALVMLGHEQTTLEARRRFENRSAVPLAADMLEAIFLAVMKTATHDLRDAYDMLIATYKSSNDFEEQKAILGSISITYDRMLLEESLNFSLSLEVRSQDITTIFKGVHIAGGPTCWNWLKDNWNAVYDKLGPGLLLRHLVSEITSKLWEHHVVDEVKEMISVQMPHIKHLGNQCSEKVKSAALWIDSIRMEEDALKKLYG